MTDVYTSACNFAILFDFAERNKIWLVRLHPGTKKPVGDNWQDTSSPNRADWESWAAAGFNIGIHLGPSRLVNVDVEAGNDRTAAWQSADHFFRDDVGIEMPTPHISSARQGFHFLFKVRDDVEIGALKKQIKFRAGIDILTGSGGVQSVAPGSYYDGTPDGKESGWYTLFDKAPDPLPVAPDRLLDLCRRAEHTAAHVNRELGKWCRDDGIALWKWCRAYSNEHPDDDESLDRYKTWKEKFAFAAGWEWGEVEGRAVIDAASSDPDEMTAGVWASCCRDFKGDPVTLVSVTQWAHARGWKGRVRESAVWMFRDVIAVAERGETWSPPLAPAPWPEGMPLPPMPAPSEDYEEAAPAIAATPFCWIEPASIEQRQWLYGHFLIRRHVTVTVAPPGTGKSSKEIVDALAMTSGRMLLHDRPYRSIRVWLWNGEDPADELQRRIAAAAIHHRLRPEDFIGRLFVDSGRNMEIKLARMEGSGTMIAEPVYDAVVDTIRQNQIDVVSIDPFVSSHSVSENDNNAIDAVTKLWAKIADATGCAVHLIHHPRKTGGAAVEAEDARGAGALIATARVVRALNVMSTEEAARAGVENRYAHVRVDDAKANLAPRSDVATWIKIENVPLGNGGIVGGDRVGVVTRWEWPDPMAGVTADDQTSACAAVAAGKWRADVQAKEWVGKPIAEALGLDLDAPSDKAKVKGMIRRWLAAGVLVTVKGMVDGKPKDFIEVGQAKRQPII